jgi:hypothetical protein
VLLGVGVIEGEEKERSVFFGRMMNQKFKFKKEERSFAGW